MAYFKVNNNDFSNYVNELSIETAHNYNAQTNAAGDTVVDYVNCKRKIKVGIIPITADVMSSLKTVFDSFSVSLSFLNPTTGKMENNVACILPKNSVDYYTIRTGNTSFKAFNLTFTEL